MCVCVCVCIALVAKLLPDQRGAESVPCVCVLVCVPALPQLQLLLLQVPLDSRRLLQRRSSALTLCCSLCLSLLLSLSMIIGHRASATPRRFAAPSSSSSTYTLYDIYVVVCICIAIGLDKMSQRRFPQNSPNVWVASQPSISTGCLLLLLLTLDSICNQVLPHCAGCSVFKAPYTAGSCTIGCCGASQWASQ